MFKSSLVNGALLLALVFVSEAIAQEVESEASEGYGKKVLELNKKIKEKRQIVAECRKKNEADEACKKQQEELQKLRDEREQIVKSLPPGKGLRKKIRKEIAIDRKKAREEKADESDSEDSTGE